MTMQFSTPVRNARGNAIEATVGTTAWMYLRSGAPPATPATADSGVLLAEIPLPADWLAAFAAGQTTINNGPWTGYGITPGTIGHFRIYGAGSGSPAQCDVQGTVTLTGNGGDAIADNLSVAEGQVVRVTAFTITEGNG